MTNQTSHGVKMMNEIPSKTLLQSLHEFAKTLTTKVRELDQLEREYRITPQQSTQILELMIESHLYSMFKTILYSHRSEPKDIRAAQDAMAQMLTTHSSQGRTFAQEYLCDWENPNKKEK